MEKKLPNFLYKAITRGYTSLGDNPAVPDYGDYGFLYLITKERYEETYNRMEDLGLPTDDIDELVTMINSLTVECMKHERPIRNFLTKICENIVNEILAIPEDTIILKCTLTDKITPKTQPRVMPDEEAYDFDDIEHMERLKSEVKKRRFIDAMIQGASCYYALSNVANNIIKEEVNKLDSELFSMYEKISAISDFLLFNKPEKIDNKNPMLDSYVEVKLGRFGKKTIIDSQGIILPSLLKETLRGFFELFSSHSLPKEDNDAMFVIKRADFIIAEPWDMRLGLPIWKRIINNFKEDIVREIPYIFTEICCSEDFDHLMKNLLIGTKYGRETAKDIYDYVVHNTEYSDFKDRIMKKSTDTALISDGCFEKDELMNYTLNEEN